MTVSPGSSSWTSKEPGPFSAHTLRATWLIHQMQSFKANQPGVWERWTPGSQQPRCNPLDLTLGAAMPSQNFSKGRFLASICHSIPAFEALVFRCLVAKEVPSPFLLSLPPDLLSTSSLYGALPPPGDGEGTIL